MAGDRIKWLRIQGFRSIADLTVEPSGLQVYVGENGAGKTTIVEAFELLSLFATEPRFVVEFAARHGDLRDLLSPGAQTLRLSLQIESESRREDDPTTVTLDYGVELGPVANSPYPVILHEELVGANVLSIFRRDTMGLKVVDHPRTASTSSRMVATPNEASALKFWGAQAPEEVLRLRRMLEGIRVHGPFETRPVWSRQAGREPGPSLRALAQLEESRRLERGGANLVSIYQQLHADGAARRQAVLEDIQLGLGQDITDFAVALKGRFSQLTLRVRDVGSIPASQLSEGQLAFLGLVALRHFEDRDATLLLFDEPELHLHPALVVRAAHLFERMAKSLPIIVMSHSEAFFDALSEPTETMRVLVLEDRRTVLHRLSREKLVEWQDVYSSVGEARREGRLVDLFEEQRAQ